MSFTFDNDIGHPMAKLILNDNKKNKNDKIISFIGKFDDDDKDDLDSSYESIILKQGKLQPVPDTKKEREVLYITGQSGSGKTYFTIQYLKQYQLTFKDREIYLFSAIPYDPEDDDYREIKGINRIKIDDTLKELNAKDFDNCCVVFDDMDCYKDKKILKIITTLRDEMLETGRHHKTTIIITYHQPTNFNDTRRIISEATSVVFFPWTSTGKVRNLLENYLDLSKEQVDKMKNEDSRWIMIRKSVIPNVIITEKSMYQRHKY